MQLLFLYWVEGLMTGNGEKVRASGRGKARTHKVKTCPKRFDHNSYFQSLSYLH